MERLQGYADGDGATYPQAAVQQARAAYQALVVAAAQINVHLSPSAYQAVRRNPADFNQSLRDWIASQIGDNAGQMSGALSSDGVRGLETHPLLPPPTQLTDRLPRGTRTSLR